LAAIDMTSFSFRTERPGDAAAIRAVLTASFGEPKVAELVASLRPSTAWEDGLSFVAEHGDRIVGYLLYTHSLLDAPRRLVDVLTLSPLGVLPGFQRKGAGSLLVRHSLEILSTRAEPLVFLEGVPGFYPRFGFERASSRGFQPPSVRIPDDAFMVKLLPNYEEWMTGALVYPDPFWRNDCVGLRAAEDS
jgi:putative acetyltransferase